MRRVPVISITLHRLAIPMRIAVEHAAAQRRVADPLVVEVELTGGTTGFGETLPREYVTGETPESVLRAIEEHFLPALLRIAPQSFAEALEAVETLPYRAADGSPLQAARAGVELALLDAYSRHFRRAITDVAGWVGLPHAGPPGSLPQVRYSGILAARGLRRVLRSLRVQRCLGLRDFKLKVGFPDDDERVRRVARALGLSRRHRRTTLRLDANGAWTVEQALEYLERWRDIPLAGVEQPLPPAEDASLSRLAAVGAPVIIADESLVSEEDAERLLGEGAVGGFNIRLSKQGGLLPALRLAARARQTGRLIVLGCMVGETSILAAAGRRFLQCVPGVRFAEGSYGRFILRCDVCRSGVGFGPGGRARPLPGWGWGIEPDPRRLAALALTSPQRWRL